MLKTASMVCMALLWAQNVRANTFIQIDAISRFSGSYSDAYRYRYPIYAEGESSIRLVLDIDDPASWSNFFGPRIEQVRIIGDTLTAYFTDNSGRTPATASLQLIFNPGILSDGLSTDLSFDDILSSSYTFNTGGHYINLQGHGVINGLVFRTIVPPPSDYRTFETRDVRDVPEPATWAMMLAGFGLIGGALRRHARRTGVICA